VHIDTRQLDTGNQGFGGTSYPSPEAVGFAAGQCTHYAYLKRPDIYWNSVNAKPSAPTGGWHAFRWSGYAAQYGHFAEGSKPLVGSIMVQPAHGGGVGHVAYVSAVADDNHFTTQEENTDGKERPNVVFTVANDRNPSSVHTAYYAADGSVHRHIGSDTVFIYGGPVVTPPQYAGYLGHVVQWDGDHKAQKPAWLVVNDGGRLRRRWIPDIPTYWCLKNAGAPGPDVLSSTVLDALEDETDVPATCSGDSTPGGGGGGALTYTELQGHHGSNTFTDPIHAAGLGPAIGAGQQVQVSCKVYAPQIASVNPDGFWYRIASDPWNNAYYAPANTFMNGDPWNGPYTHNTDFAVPTCDGGSPGTTPTPTPTPTPVPTQAPPRTWSETAGGVAHTWTNYSNAGGTQGPSIAGGQTVQISCRLTGFQVADGNTWWYRIAQSPWNNSFYVSADAFYNNGQTSGSLHGTPFVDPNVAMC
jgi:surface antigen